MSQNQPNNRPSHWANRQLHLTSWADPLNWGVDFRGVWRHSMNFSSRVSCAYRGEWQLGDVNNQTGCTTSSQLTMCTLDLTVEIPENIQNMLYQRSLQGPHVLPHEAKLMAVHQPISRHPRSIGTGTATIYLFLHIRSMTENLMS